MLLKKSFLFFAVLLVSASAFSQVSFKKVNVTGKIIDKETSLPVEFSVITFSKSDTKQVVTGGSADANGNFNIEINSGNYDIKFEFPGYKTQEKLNQNISADTNLGNILLETESNQIETVVIRSEKTTVDIKMDKKVYNVGQDLMVKGGTVSDVLGNIPSVTVDAEGAISLRGNENVKVLIDGKPSNAISVNDALKMLPADAVDKVEVITNPSARYDAEGGAGILNIILKKGKTNGFNGTVMATAGTPANNGLSGTLNYKTNQFNLFTTQGYTYRSNPGYSKVNTRYLNDDNTTKSYIDEDRENSRINKSYNGGFGFDWYLDKSTTWTNSVNFRKNSGDNEENVNFNNFDSNRNFTFYRNRLNREDQKDENIEYNTNLVKNFSKTGHKLTIDGSFSDSKNYNNSIIFDNSTSSASSIDLTKNNQKQNRNLIQADYVLPIGDKYQFEAGYRGNFVNMSTDYAVLNNGVVNDDFTNVLEYTEKVNALYTQFGMKFNKLSMLYGLRFEDSDIDIDQITSAVYKNKKYNNFFPSAFFTYELTDDTNLSLNYSKRINRPRGRQLNPFSTYSSNINIFRGNPDLNPTLTDAVDLGFLTKLGKITLSTSAYYNYTKNSTQMVRYVQGLNPDFVPITVSSFVNIGEENRTGFEFTLNYSPYKWWKLNSNFNLFRVQTVGDFHYSYYDEFDNLIQKTQNFDNTASSWFARINSKISLPLKIDWQTNATYSGAQKNAQGGVKGMFGMNLGFSKDVFKDKATIALNVNDVFNSRVRRSYTYNPGQIDSESEFQWRKRQITVSFTYRFNKQKNDKEKQPKSQDQENGGEF
ncbi:TonB-dependent receptor domain-containing protein [Flavobacterium terrigena]|uniref:Outer membrane receptor for ferrienterochelin and colicins n=1 Tax=Flavobacterium terrigena TaxID=402734 RepID=A0A1H6QA83_9FLAO|nr:TonB-dependent receptor [Flavobacterium terrigena]SEI38756.1 Outer membrane receptor for ferrienterochelin and colicins [Flavobacterium terrigena]